MTFPLENSGFFISKMKNLGTHCVDVARRTGANDSDLNHWHLTRVGCPLELMEGLVYFYHFLLNVDLVGHILKLLIQLTPLAPC